MTSHEAQIAFHALWPAAAIACAVMVIAWWPLSRRGSLAGGYWGPALSCGAGFIATFIIVCGGWPGFRPAERWQWLLQIAMAATVIGLIASAWRPAPIMRWIAAIALAVCTSALLQPLPDQSAWNWRIALGVSAFMSLALLEPLSHRGGASLPLSLCIVFAGASQVLTLIRIATLGLAAASLSAVLGVIFVACLVMKRVSLANGAMYVIAAMLPAILAVGWAYNRAGQVGAASFVLLGAAPVALWIGEIRALRSKSAPAGLFRIIASVVIVALAVGLAMKQASGD